VICVSLGVWSACTWATGQARDFEELLWVRALMGVSEAFYMPAALALTKMRPLTCVRIQRSASQPPSTAPTIAAICQ
jgi:hypothetical protein